MPHIVEGLGAIVTNKGVFAKLHGGDQPSALVKDQNKLTIYSRNEDPLIPASLIDTEIDLNADGITFKLPTNTANSQLLCLNSDPNQLIQFPAGTLNVTTPTAVGGGAGVGAGAGSVAVGTLAGASGQLANSVAVGNSAGSTNQGQNSVAIGGLAGTNTQGENSVAVGYQSGHSTQGNNSVAVGRQAGNQNQGDNSVAVGWNAAKSSQASNSVAVGLQAGVTNQETECVALGYNSGQITQGSKSISIGSSAGLDSMNQESIAIGYHSCRLSGDAGDYSTSIGSQTKHAGQYGVSLGYKAGLGGAVNHSFHIGMNGYINPSTLGNSCMRPEPTTAEDALNIWRLMALNTSTGEIKYLTGLSNQPLNPGTVEPLTMDITTGEIGHA